MTIAHRGRDKLRAQLLKRYRVYEALYLITNSIAADNRNTFVVSKDTISVANRKAKLREFLRRVDDEIRKLRKHYGVTVSDSELIDLAEHVENVPGQSISWIPKVRYQELFSRPDRILPGFDALPEHTFIGIDPGKYRIKAGTCELFILEAKIFEDLAALFNIAKEYAAHLDANRDGKPAHKTLGAICRAVVAYSVFFFEAYLNGIAADYVLKNEKNLDKETQGLLLDWDSSKGRPRYMSLRDKAFKYPRIILGTDHSPLQEGNTPELSIILETATKFRDLIAQPSFKSDPEALKIFFGVEFTKLEEIVDAAVELVRKFETAIRGDTLRLDWLPNRGPDGKFPESVFD